MRLSSSTIITKFRDDGHEFWLQIANVVNVPYTCERKKKNTFLLLLFATKLISNEKHARKKISNELNCGIVPVN